LERLLTWDLPLPRNPVAGVREVTFDETTSRSGVVIVLPWYLLRGSQYDVAALLQKVRLTSSPEHLSGWLGHGSEGTARLGGEMALQQKLWLYRVYALVLARRYGTLCEGNTDRLDEALARVLRKSQSLVRQLRQSLMRDLKCLGDP
jgi:hypothetical protein